MDVIWREHPTLRAPVMVCAFRGWNDAGEAASTAVSFINDRFESSEVARLDPEEFYDFTAVRPTVRLTEGSRARSTGRRTPSGRRRCPAPRATS